MHLHPRRKHSMCVDCIGDSRLDRPAAAFLSTGGPTMPGMMVTSTSHVNIMLGLGCLK